MDDRSPATLRHVTGDATTPVRSGRRLLVHVCNDVGGWGRGFVVAVSARWPDPEEAYRRWYRDGTATCPLTGRRVPFALGQALPVVVEPGLAVVNLVAQHGVRRGRDGRPPVRYDAISDGLAQVAALAVGTGASVHCPRLGAGLAGGDWARVAALLESRVVARGVDVTVYDLPDAPPVPGPADEGPGHPPGRPGAGG